MKLVTIYETTKANELLCVLLQLLSNESNLKNRRFSYEKGKSSNYYQISSLYIIPCNRQGGSKRVGDTSEECDRSIDRKNGCRALAQQ